MRKKPGLAPSNSQAKPAAPAGPSATHCFLPYRSIAFRPFPSNRSPCYGRWIRSTDGGGKHAATDRLGEDTGSHCGALVRPTPLWSRSVVLGRPCPSSRAGRVRRQPGFRYCPTLVRGPRMSMPVSPSSIEESAASPPLEYPVAVVAEHRVKCRDPDRVLNPGQLSTRSARSHLSARRGQQ
jgi:hypothetical protein